MEQLTVVGIDVSKGKSVVCAMRPAGVCELPPFQVLHTKEGLNDLIKILREIEGDVRIVMEYTGMYYQVIAKTLYEAGFFVSVVHAKLVHDFGNNTIRKGKTDKKDAIKIANYGLAYWHTLQPMGDVDHLRDSLKKLNRQLSLYSKIETSLKNNLIALLDLTFPCVNTLFPPIQKTNGHEKWVDFAQRFWHIECVASLSLKAFSATYQTWCKKTNSRFNAEKASEIYNLASNQVATLPKDKTTKFIVRQATSQYWKQCLPSKMK